MKERIWVVSEVFFPDTDIASGNIATEIAIKLSEQFEVHVICGPKDYGVTRDEAENYDVGANIVLHRWHAFNYNKNNAVKRLFRVAGISIGLFLKGFNIRKGEKVLVISNPAFITPLYALLKAFKGFRYVLLMHDVFPENLVTGGFIKPDNYMYRATKWFFEKCRVSANKIIVIGRDMKELLLQHFPSSREDDISIIPNWTDVENIYPQCFAENEIIRELQLSDNIVVLFAGNHGVLQNLSEFIKIAEQVENPLVHFVFAGGGSEKAGLENYVRDRKLENMTFLPAFPRADLNKTLNACHIGLVSLSDKLYGVGVPSKSYNILGAGKPIFFVGNKRTEIPEFVAESDIGWVFSYDDTADIVNFFNQLSGATLHLCSEKGLRGRRLMETDYSKSKILEQLHQFLNDIK